MKTPLSHKTMNLIDSHAHLTFDELQKNLDDVLQKSFRPALSAG